MKANAFVLRLKSLVGVHTSGLKLKYFSPDLSFNAPNNRVPPEAAENLKNLRSNPHVS